jgi:hypothetical protein
MLSVLSSQAKLCKKCGSLLHEEAYYRTSSGRRDNTCKACRLRRTRELYQADPKTKLAKNREWMSTHKGRMKYLGRRWQVSHREELRIKSKEFRVRHRKTLKLKKVDPIRSRAYCSVHWALRVGKLIKGPCRECGSEKAQAHHHDYTKRLDVVWLCPSCHKLYGNKYKDPQ